MTKTQIDPKTTDPATMAAERISKDLPELRLALLEMLAYQAVMGSKTAYYHYPLDEADHKCLAQYGLVAVRQHSPNGRKAVRLTKFGREVASKFTEVQE